MTVISDLLPTSFRPHFRRSEEVRRFWPKSQENRASDLGFRPFLTSASDPLPPAPPTPRAYAREGRAAHAVRPRRKDAA